MELNYKEQVLVALYLEYQKDISHMDNVCSINLGIDNDMFMESVSKLNDEGLVYDVPISRGGRGMRPISVSLKHCKITSYGYEYIDEIFKFHTRLSNKEKINRIIDKCKSSGYERLVSFVSLEND